LLIESVLSTRRVFHFANPKRQRGIALWLFKVAPANPSRTLRVMIKSTPGLNEKNGTDFAGQGRNRLISRPNGRSEFCCRLPDWQFFENLLRSDNFRFHHFLMICHRNVKT